MTSENQGPSRKDPRGAPRDFARGPVVAGGALAVILIGGLAAGLAGGLSASPAAHVQSGKQVEGPAEAPDPATTGRPAEETPGTGVPTPSPTPDRDSDQEGENNEGPEALPVRQDHVYYIQAGDTLTSISAEFEISVDALAEYNRVRDVNVINEGAVLLVPYVYTPPEGWDAAC